MSHQHPNSDSHTQLTRGPGDKDTHRAQEARGAPTQTPWRCAGGHGRRQPKQEPAKTACGPRTPRLPEGRERAQAPTH